MSQESEDVRRLYSLSSLQRFGFCGGVIPLLSAGEVQVSLLGPLWGQMSSLKPLNKAVGVSPAFRPWAALTRGLNLISGNVIAPRDQGFLFWCREQCLQSELKPGCDFSLSRAHCGYQTSVIWSLKLQRPTATSVDGDYQRYNMQEFYVKIYFVDLWTYIIQKCFRQCSKFFLVIRHSTKEKHAASQLASLLFCSGHCLYWFLVIAGCWVTLIQWTWRRSQAGFHLQRGWRQQLPWSHAASQLHQVWFIALIERPLVAGVTCCMFKINEVWSCVKSVCVLTVHISRTVPAT